jgi:2-beta-glucuronyltransferase
MRRAVLITGHFAQQKRKGSMLWVSDHLQRMGWHVTIVTVGYSWLSRVRGDARLAVLDRLPPQGAQDLSPTLTAQFGLPLLHPFATRSAVLNRALEHPFRHFATYWHKRLQAPLRGAALVICESGAPVLLAPSVARQAPGAARLYRVNDDIRLLNAPPMLVRAEQANQQYFTRISTASPLLAARFAGHPRVTLDPMGIPSALLTLRPDNPYVRRANGPVAVCAGTTQLDIPALRHIAATQPHWDIHVIGRLKSPPPEVANITWHGEQSFAVTLAHVAHADIGLAPYLDAPGVAYQATNSNRILLYRHFGLPTLGPDALCNADLPSIIGYSAPDGPARCEAWIKTPEGLPDWSALALSLAQNVETDPPSEVSTDPPRTVKSRVRTVPALTSSA